MRHLMAALYLIFILTANAQLTQTIRGQVTDLDNKNPLAGASISVKFGSETTGAFSDNQGNFSIANVGVGRIDIVVKMMGYEDRIYNQIELKSGKELVLEVTLTEAFSKVATVTIVGKKQKEKPLNEMATLSSRSFTVEETSRYAAAAFDPARMAQNFAGVTSGGDDLFNEIVVRGNSPKGVLWRLEGIEIANPNHFAAGGAQGGAISMLSSSTLGNSDFFTGAFPAEYGNAMSGVFDLRFRKGNNKHRESSFMLGALGVEVSTEGPFSKNYKGSYLVNYRYSTLGLLQKTGLSPTGDLLPEYQDLSYHIFLPTKKLGHFSIFGVMGQSVAEMYDEWSPTDTSELTLDDYDGFSEVSTVNTTGIKHVYNIKNKGYLKTVMSHSYSKSIGLDDVLEIDTITNLAFRFQEDEINNIEAQLRLSTMFNYKINSRNTLRAGVIATQMNYNFVSKFYDYTDGTTFVAFNDTNSGQQYQAYSQLKFRATSKLTLNGGFHYTYFAPTNSSSFEPRMAASYKLSPKTRLSLAIGKHSKPEHLALYLFSLQDDNGNSIRPNDQLEISKAWHYVLAFDHKIKPNVRIKAEAYYQHLFDIPISTKPGSTVSVLNTSNYWDAIFGSDTSHLMNGGTGTNLGIDLTLEKFFANQYYYLVTATLFNSTYKTTTDISYNTKYNGNYQLNVLGGKEFTLKKENRIIGVNAKANFYGGNRYTGILLEESKLKGRGVYDIANPFGVQTPLYYRFDIGFSYKFNRPQTTHSIMVDVQNVTARDNIGGIFYNSNKQNIQSWTMTGLFPFINYRIEF